jgi:4-hydroxy-tetrahydrodipicolinate synthase
MIQHFESGQVSQASQIHAQLLPLFKALFLTANPIPLKAALRLMGWEVGGCRLPLCDVPNDVVTELQRVMKELKLL